MLVKRLSAKKFIGKNSGGSLGWDGTQDAHWELGRKLGGRNAAEKTKSSGQVSV